MKKMRFSLTHKIVEQIIFHRKKWPKKWPPLFHRKGCNSQVKSFHGKKTAGLRIAAC